MPWGDSEWKEGGAPPAVSVGAGDRAVHIVVDQETERARPAPGAYITYKGLVLLTCFYQPHSQQVGPHIPSTGSRRAFRVVFKL